MSAAINAELLEAAKDLTRQLESLAEWCASLGYYVMDPRNSPRFKTNKKVIAKAEAWSTAPKSVNAHLVEIRYKGATDTRGSQVALISKRFPKDRVAEGYNSGIGNTCRQGNAMLEAMGYTVICSMKNGELGYMAAVKEFKPLKEARLDFMLNAKRKTGEPMSDFKPEAKA